MRLKDIEALNVNETNYRFSSKTGQMEKDDSDPDQRHGIFINNKLVQTYNTKDEADNAVKYDKRFASGIVKKIVN